MAPPPDHLKLIIQRFDTHITGSNTKGAFLLAFNTFLCGGLMANYEKLTKLVGPTHLGCFKTCLLILFLLGMVSLVYVLRAMYPFMDSGNSTKGKYHSLIFFKSVAEFETADEYAECLEKQGADDSYKDLSKQIYYVAIGLNKKYNNIKVAAIIIYMQICFVAFLLGIIICDKI